MTSTKIIKVDFDCFFPRFINHLLKSLWLIKNDFWQMQKNAKKSKKMELIRTFCICQKIFLINRIFLHLSNHFLVYQIFFHLSKIFVHQMEPAYVTYEVKSKPQRMLVKKTVQNSFPFFSKILSIEEGNLCLNAKEVSKFIIIQVEVDHESM